MHEIKVLKQLKDAKTKNVNVIFDAFQIHSQLWIVNEYCPGGSVRTLVSLVLVCFFNPVPLIFFPCQGSCRFYILCSKHLSFELHRGVSPCINKSWNLLNDDVSWAGDLGNRVPYATSNERSLF